MRRGSTRTLAALTLLLFTSAGCTATSPPDPDASASALAVTDLLDDPATHEGRGVLIRAELVVGRDGGFLTAVDGSDAPIYPPDPATSIFVAATADNLPVATRMCTSAVGSTDVIRAPRIVVQGVYRHDEERVFGPKPGWEAQIEAPRFSCA